MGRITKQTKTELLSWPKALLYSFGVYLILGIIAILVCLYFSRDLPSIEQLKASQSGTGYSSLLLRWGYFTGVIYSASHLRPDRKNPTGYGAGCRIH